MGIFSKVGLHIADKALGTQAQGVKVGTDLTEGLHPVVQIGGFVVGAFVGSLVGGMRLINPTSILDSLLTSDEELTARIDKKSKAAYGDNASS